MKRFGPSCSVSFWARPIVAMTLGCLAAAPALAQQTGNSEPATPPTEPATPPTEPAAVEVTVRAVRRAPGSFHAVTSRTLERFRYDDAHQVLSLVPGVYVRQEDGFGLRPNIGIRGALSDRSKKVALMEDGILFAPAPYSAPAAYYFPVLARAYQMRVIKGPAAIAYGPQTIGGAVDLLTRPIPERGAGALDISAGSYGHAKLHAYYGDANADGGFSIEGVHLQSDGFKQLPDGADTGFYRNEWSLKAERRLARDSEVPHDLSLKLMYSDEASNESYLGLSDQDFREAPLRRYPASALDRMEWHRTSAVLSHRMQPLPRFSLTTTLYRHDLARVWRKFNGLRGANVNAVLRNPATPQNAIFQGVLAGTVDGSSSAEAVLIGPNDRDFVSQGVQTRAAWQTSSGELSHQIEYGVRLHYDRVERRHSEDAFRMAAGELVPEGSPTVVNTYNEAETQALALHALDAIGWRGLTVTPGVRAELIRSTYVDKINGDSGSSALQVVLPGVGLHYALIEEVGLLAGVHRGMSPPAPGARTSSPELSVNYEGGARYLAGKRRVELIGYYNEYSNLADQCTFSSGCAEQDIDAQFDAGRARIYGFEAFFEDDVALGPIRIPLSATYTLTLTEFLETFQSEDPIFGEVEAGDELPYVPRHQGRASLGVEHALVGGYVAATFVSPMREESGQGPITFGTDRQISWDAGTYLQLRDPLSLRIRLQVQNALNDHFIVSRRPFGARPNAPRIVQVGAQIEF